MIYYLLVFWEYEVTMNRLWSLVTVQILKFRLVHVEESLYYIHETNWYGLWKHNENSLSKVWFMPINWLKMLCPKSWMELAYYVIFK